jgi:hypothetical protein
MVWPPTGRLGVVLALGKSTNIIFRNNLSIYLPYLCLPQGGRGYLCVVQKSPRA